MLLFVSFLDYIWQLQKIKRRNVQAPLKNSELSIRNRAALEARVQFLYRLSSFSSCFYRSYMVLLP